MRRFLIHGAQLGSNCSANENSFTEHAISSMNAWKSDPKQHCEY